MALLVRHAWPGNVRELRGVIRQVVVSSRGEPTLRADAATRRALAEEARAEPERADILAALRAHGWSFAKAARALGVSRSALYRRAEADPSLRTGGEIDREELERCLRAHEGDLSRTAEHLRISERALKLRLRALGLDG
ncbi:MAG: helix-turn-helix domain-containing protein [Sandaracinaceae bacterium]|nr:helix-turn-helix domain-containing protein [Sandaracinaceae bacterium]